MTRRSHLCGTALAQTIITGTSTEHRPMRIRYDPGVDPLSVVFGEATVTTREIADGIVAEYDAQQRLVGLEILDAGTRYGDPSTVREATLGGVAIQPDAADHR